MSRTSLAPVPDVARPDPTVPRPPQRSVAVLAVLGTVLLAAGTVLHPADADPGSPAAAFAEYASVGRGEWVASHLLQLGGVAAVVLVVVLLARAVAGAREWAWVRVADISGAAGLATAAVLQAVDGIALKAVVDLWSAAGEDRAELFAAAVAVRSIEVGLAAVLALVLGVAALALGIVLVRARAGSRGLGAVAVGASVAAVVNGVALALGGFSAAAMLASTVSGVLTLALMLLTAGWSWRRSVPPPSARQGSRRRAGWTA